ncbi:MAG: hypothetical protein ACKVP7_14225 [Hyphomicrobiaceae bacterium]
MIKALTLALAIVGVTAGYAAAQTTPTAPAPTTPAPAAAPAPAATPAPALGTPAPSGSVAGTTTTGTAATAATTQLVAATNPDDCLKTASDLALDAEERKLAEDKLDKVEDLLVKMETHCDSKQFPEALAVAKDIKSLIETR